MYQLKPGQETFQVIDGPLAGSTYHRGRRYAEIPDVEKHRFEIVMVPVAEPAPLAVESTDKKPVTREKNK